MTADNADHPAPLGAGPVYVNAAGEGKPAGAVQVIAGGFPVDLAFVHARWHRALDDLAAEAPGPIRTHIEQHDARVRHDAVAGVLALCDEWDQLSKGETPTTARIRAAINGRQT